MPLIELKDLTYWYPDREDPAIEDVSLEVEEGEFVLILGPTGCGKSTLMRVLNGLVPHFHGGRVSGKAVVAGRDLARSTTREMASLVGMVFQDPEDQAVTTSVEREIAFGLESMALPPGLIARRVEEMLSGMGLSRLREAFIPTLSGGELQKVILASVMAAHPRLLVLDEPTSQLDPVGAEELLNLVRRIHEEMGTTVIMSEHRLERCYHYASRVIYMEEGRILFDGEPSRAAAWLRERGKAFLPPVARVFARAGWEDLPLTVVQGRRLIAPLMDGFRLEDPGAVRPDAQGAEETVSARGLWYLYPEGKEALRGIDLHLRAGESLAVLGENGAGKSTLVRCLLGLLNPTRGKVRVLGNAMDPGRLAELRGEIGYCPQSVRGLFLRETVREELLLSLSLKGMGGGKAEEMANSHLERLGLDGLAERHPWELSSGERELAALAVVTVGRPRLLFLDEPTRGLDYPSKEKVIGLLEELEDEGCALLAVTHDVEFAAAASRRAAILGGGRVVAEGSSREVLGDSLFFSPQVSRLLRGYGDGVTTEREAVDLLRELASGDPETLRPGKRSDRA
ncbi:MAG: ATP-binding cassette domain-containing protein [Candidatus Geothermincolales bacterium]